MRYIKRTSAVLRNQYDTSDYETLFATCWVLWTPLADRIQNKHTIYTLSCILLCKNLRFYFSPNLATDQSLNVD